jgi:hypothetical protein
MIEVLKQALTDAKRNERHNNVAETRYWLNQYKLIAEQAIAQHPPQRTWVGLAKEDRLCAKYMQDAPDGIEAVIDYIESKLKELNT